MAKLKRVTVTVNPNDYQALTRLAETCDVSRSWLIRKGMREVIRKGARTVPMQADAHGK